jgi:hypothetical protein
MTRAYSMNMKTNINMNMALKKTLMMKFYTEKQPNSEADPAPQLFSKNRKPGVTVFLPEFRVILSRNSKLRIPRDSKDFCKSKR